MNKENVNRDKVSEYLTYLEEIGWSELIDSRWKCQVLYELTSHFTDIDKNDIEYALDIVLV